MKDKPTSKEQLGVLAQPKNLLKTIASVVPGASIGAAMLDQLEGYEIEKRIDTLEAQQQLAAKIRALEILNPLPPAPLHDWSIPANEFLRRTVDIAVAYDGGFHSHSKAGKELIQPLAHACLIGKNEVLICKEATELARDVAIQKNGKVVILSGLAWYSFRPEPIEEACGLAIHRISERDDEKWLITMRELQDNGLDNMIEEMIEFPVRHSVSTWMGQELGFIHSGEAKDVMSDFSSFSDKQFDTSAISHFRKPRINALKVAVTGVLSGRITQVGSPVFNRDGMLLGIISDIESYESDAGRRAVVRTLLGLPRFTKFTKKQPAKGDP